MDVKKSEISVLIKEMKYDEIVEHLEATREQKTVALMKMDRFKEALKYCYNNTFEKAYCFYRIGKYKCALKTAGKKKGSAWISLRSQIYYKLDRHLDAIKEIGKLKEIKGPVLVNYAANVALAIAENKAEADSTKGKEMATVLEKIKNEKIDIQGEVLYNLAFSYLPDRRKVLNKLKEIDTPDRDHRELVQAQIHNIQDMQKEISPSILNRSNKAIHRYNTEAIQSPCLLESMKQFQKNTYYQNKIKQYSQTKDVPELCNIIDDLKQNNTKPIIRLISRLNRKNALHLKKVLKDEKILSNGLNRIVIKKK
ncbi:hypothetical protein NEMIN01_1396 [Nematocida minor]|uniref:uncharacterized protein n=1 Tax=Nematocida minor TaxID=1912983 RepID=UPI00221EA93F|nr:uncharacterized protein NEMIN01_1396 [Nematocida minor]KAI5191188.1 hypothetical protein NEMIN01_1396 [Nematocida minor]